MKNHLLKERIKRKECRKWYYTVSVTMAAIVVFCTVYALILPAITLEKNQKVLDCPLSIHQHTAECYAPDGEPVCGQADFVIHMHSESCYDIEGELVCKLPETPAHEHTDACYEEQRRLICENSADEHIHDDTCYLTEKISICKDAAVLHKHDDACYDDDGTLSCGRLQVTEHVHGAACFKTEENTSVPAPNDDIMPAADVAGDTTETCGYKEDGSIWWTKAQSELKMVTEIKENTPYIIMGYQGNTLMTNEVNEITMEGDDRNTYPFCDLKAIDKKNVTDYKAYQRWCFERADSGNDGYYIYYLADNNTKQYLQFVPSDLVKWKYGTQCIYLTDKAQATVFTVQSVKDLSDSSEAENYPDHIAAYVEENGKRYYINSYYGDRTGSSTHWWGYGEASGGSFLQICQYNEHLEDTAQRVNTAVSPNTVINLFDYWVSENRNDADNKDALLDKGINKNHAFKFVHGDQSNTTGMPLNRWTGQGKDPRQGIVNKALDSSGYPSLSGNFPVEGFDSDESLEYLFNPTREHDGKKSYRNVGGLLSIDDEGYYSFDCKKNMAEFNEESGSFYIYDKPGANGSFFPFNKAPEIMLADKFNPLLNHYFGMTITTRFIQQHGGFTGDNHSTATTFYFSGDDDVWIFIDGVLVGDAGGIHDAASISINFATGEVEVAVNKANAVPIKTTLYQCYEAAGKVDATEWDDSNTTYKDGTVHTLKFYYLERGNYDSHLTLKYNLTEIPETAIYKVDQYGDTVPGATFAVYAADEKYTLLDKKNGQKVTLPDKYVYDTSGNIVDDQGQPLANALYTGITNQDGEMIFADMDGMPYSINELQDMFGERFILREIKVPDGYRVVSKDIHLQFWKGESQTILKCDNTEQSGSRAASRLQITATDTLYLQEAYHGETTVQYYDPSIGKPFGTLFAVVYRYVGKIDENGQATEINENKNWVPVYGSDKDGYHMVDLTDGKTATEGALEAAEMAQEYGEVVFKVSSSGTMQLTMENLPGHITTYYRMLGQEQKKNARYTVAYYWTDASELKNATSDNIYRVYTFAEATPDGSSYSGFERVFGAAIQVPNLINKVFVQKMDENNALINGATFALYQVHQDDASGEIRYLADNKSYVTLTANAAVGSDGVITDGTTTIKPLKTDVTKTYTDGVHVGTAEFSNLPDGQYIIKEVKAPPGYKLNMTDVMVLVTEDTIYANAGTEDDGITVGRGPGYLVAPLSQFASEGQIDNTLTWIYARMLITGPSTNFKDALDKNKVLGYLTENNSCKFGEKGEARSYLKYVSDADAKAVVEGKAFNYVPNDARTAASGAQNPTGTRRLFTTVGWNHYAILQDYDYGLKQIQANNANPNYENWSGKNLMNLFSRSTYIRVTDKSETTLAVKKVDELTPSKGLAGAGFRLYKMEKLSDGREVKLYYQWNPETKAVEWLDKAENALVVTTGENGIADKNFIGLKDGVYYLEEVKAPNGYYKLAEPVKLTLRQAQVTVDSPDGVTAEDWLDEATNLYTYMVIVPNSSSFELPATGGSGTILYTAGGILLMAAALVYGYRKKHKSEKRTG